MIDVIENNCRLVNEYFVELEIALAERMQKSDYEEERKLGNQRMSVLRGLGLLEEKNVPQPTKAMQDMEKNFQCEYIISAEEIQEENVFIKPGRLAAFEDFVRVSGGNIERKHAAAILGFDIS